MRNLDRRVIALEIARPHRSGTLKLDDLTDEDLNRLEQIVLRRDAGEAIETMCDDDLRFLAGISVH